jgi:DNA invertase Pin-like site-specific DNA recombinase
MEQQTSPLEPAILYAAKSTPDEKGSIDGQLKEGRKETKELGLKLAGEYSEENVSAYKGDRGPELAAALEHAERIGATLIVQHSDRLARGDAKQARHLVEIALWALKADVKIHCIQDPRTFASIQDAAVMGERNMEDSKRKSGAIKRGLKQRREEGIHTGRVPFGYGYRRNEADQRVLLIDEEKAPWVRCIFAHFLAGWSYPNIARWLEAEGVLTATGESQWNPITPRQIVTNPVYAGLIRDGEELIQATHEAIIDRETWDRSVALRKAKARTHKRGRPSAGKHLFRKGFLKCGICGESIGPVTDRKRTGPQNQIYFCYGQRRRPHTCDLGSVSRGDIDDAVYAYFRDLALDAEATREQLVASKERELAELRDLLQSAEQDTQTVKECLERVKRDYVSGELSAAEWQELRGELEPDLSAAQAEEERLCRQLEEAESESALSKITVDLLTQLSEIRAEIAKEVSDAEEAAAVRAALMRIFDGFVLHRGSPRHEKREYIKVAHWLEPVLSQDQTGGYADRLRKKLRTTGSGFPIGRAENNADPAILFEVKLIRIRGFKEWRLAQEPSRRRSSRRSNRSRRRRRSRAATSS